MGNRCNLNTARGLNPSSTGGTQTAALLVGGEVLLQHLYTNTESWNGSAWTEVNDLNHQEVMQVVAWNSNFCTCILEVHLLLLEIQLLKLGMVQVGQRPLI